MLNKLMEKINSYFYTIETNNNSTTIEIEFKEYSMVFMVINNQCKIFKFDLDNNIIDESKWYKRAGNVWNKFLSMT